jgi:hypothetical protein
VHWHDPGDLLLLTLRRYALDDHVLCDPTGVAPTAAWVRLDSIVLAWMWGRSPSTSTASSGTFLALGLPGWPSRASS